MIEHKLVTDLNRVLPDDAQCIKLVVDLNKLLPNDKSRLNL